MDANTRNELKALLRAREWSQQMRINVSNRMEIKKDGSRMKSFGSAMLDDESIPYMIAMKEACNSNEEMIEKKITSIVKKDRMWKEFFSTISGIGPMGAAYLLAEIDIEKASTRARIWQFCGLNSGMILGKKVKANGDVEVTGELVRGDRKTAGFKCPYNSWLKPKLYGVIAKGMILASGRSSRPNKYYKIYLDRKNRTSQSESCVGDSEKKWKDEPNAHIDMDAQRFMLKQMLSDFYETYRAQEGLEVRVRYEEEYLGRKHHAD